MNHDTPNIVFRAIGALAGATFVLLTISPPAFAGANATLHGKTIGQWSAEWFMWQEANFPDFDFGEGVIDCSVGQSGPVWFLGGTSGGAPVARECDAPIKGHKHLVFPLVNAAFNNDEPDGLTVEEKRELLDGLFSEDPPGAFNSTACLLQAEVDDVPVVYGAPIVRIQSPTFERAGDPEAVGDGFWVILPRLPRGEHEIHFTGGLCDLDSGDVLLNVEVTYTLTVR